MGKIIQGVLEWSFVKGPTRFVEFVLLMLADITIVEHSIVHRAFKPTSKCKSEQIEKRIRNRKHSKYNNT